METIVRVAGMSLAAGKIRGEGRTIGLVPTMGSLHAGHLELIRIARERADVVVVSVFVNPTQFGPGEDFDAYPRDADRDSGLAAGAGADVVFMPTVAEMFPAGYGTWVDVDTISGVLEGKSRPGHFRGVATVVTKLFNIVRPHIGVFGQKDAQQVAVIRRVARELNAGVEIVVVPTVRERDGLALSSRNAYLDGAERQRAAALRRSLDAAGELVRSGERSATKIVDAMKQVIDTHAPATIDYISVADPDTLQEVRVLQPGAAVLISLAVRIGRTRLIDNDILTVS